MGLHDTAPKTTRTPAEPGSRLWYIEQAQDQNLDMLAQASDVATVEKFMGIDTDTFFAQDLYFTGRIRDLRGESGD